MSTRCQIGFYDNVNANIDNFDVLLYKHQDGYQDGILPILTPIVKRFIEGRGMDTEYMSAWVLFEFMEEYVHWSISYNAQMGRPRVDGKDFLSFGVCGDKFIHGDIEYFYGVYEDRIVVCDGDLEIIEEIYYGVCEY